MIASGSPRHAAVAELPAILFERHSHSAAPGGGRLHELPSKCGQGRGIQRGWSSPFA